MGSAESAFAGPNGNYDVFIAYHDEIDGVAQLTVEISGENVATLNLDEASGDAQPTERNLRIRQIASDRRTFRDLPWNFAMFLYSLIGPSLMFFVQLC